MEPEAVAPQRGVESRETCRGGFQRKREEEKYLFEQGLLFFFFFLQRVIIHFLYLAVLLVSFLYSHYIFRSNYFYFSETSLHCAGFQTSAPESYYRVAEDDPGKGPKPESQVFP